MKIVGTLDTKDDGDLLPEVLNSLEGFDYIFAYNDGSQDSTENILKSSSKITDYVNRKDFSAEELASVPQHRRHYLLNWMHKIFDGTKEDVWVIRLEGDRFFLNQTPKQMIKRAELYGYQGLSAGMVDYRLPPKLNWDNYDSWPRWLSSIRNIQTYCRIDDVHPLVAFKLTPDVHYDKNKIRPWPRITGPTDYLDNDVIGPNTCLMAHHGRRGPKYWSWAYGTSGSRKRSSRWPAHWDFSTPEKAYATVDDGPFLPPMLWPASELDQAVKYWNSKHG